MAQADDNPGTAGPQRENGDSLESEGGSDAEPEPVSSEPAAAPVRKPGAPKEVIPFAWKLVGYSGTIPVTLLKCVEREEAEAQLQRSREEGYYTDLTIHPIGMHIPLPKEAKLPTAKPAPARTSSPKAAEKPVVGQGVVKVKLADSVKAAEKKPVRKSRTRPARVADAAQPRPGAKSSPKAEAAKKPKPAHKPKPSPEKKPKAASTKKAAAGKTSARKSARKPAGRKKPTGKKSSGRKR